MLYLILKDFAGPLATVIAAFSAVGVTGYFAFRQWQTAKEQAQTAREKLLLDLFDKRFAVYDELRSAVMQYVASGMSQTRLVDDFTRAASRAQFLFGPEVQTFLEGRRRDLNRDMYERNRPRPEESETQRERGGKRR